LKFHKRKREQFLDLFSVSYDSTENLERVTSEKIKKIVSMFSKCV